jgi:hypothetical protein
VERRCGADSRARSAGHHWPAVTGSRMDLEEPALFIFFLFPFYSLFILFLFSFYFLFILFLFSFYSPFYFLFILFLFSFI